MSEITNHKTDVFETPFRLITYDEILIKCSLITEKFYV